MNSILRSISLVLLLTNVSFSQTIYSTSKNFVNNSLFENSQVALKIVDLSTKEVLFSENADKIMPTASTTKLFSTAYALEELGPSYCSKTLIGYNGNIVNHVLKGDLIIQSFGDLSLGSKYFAEKKDSFLAVWTKALEAKKITRIEGSIIVDGSLFGYESSPPDWQWGDIGNAYGAHFSATNLYDNILLYTFKTGKAGTISELIYTSPSIDINFDNRIYAGKVNGDNSSLFGAVHSSDRYGTGLLPENKSAFTIRGSLPDPELTLALVFQKYLLQNGIVCNTAISGRKLDVIPIFTDTLCVYTGKKLIDILQVTNHESVNLFAEGLMQIAAYEKAKVTTHTEACTELEKYWRRKINAKNLILNDGSGLSRTNCISASMLTDLLAYMQKSDYKDEFYNSLPLAGINGTLRSVSKNKPAQGVMRAKSGTMRRVKSYAGYVDCKSGKRLAFAIISNNHTCSNKELLSTMEPIFDAMANY